MVNDSFRLFVQAKWEGMSETDSRRRLLFSNCAVAGRKGVPFSELLLGSLTFQITAVNYSEVRPVLCVCEKRKLTNV